MTHPGRSPPPAWVGEGQGHFLPQRPGGSGSLDSSDFLYHLPLVQVSPTTEQAGALGSHQPSPTPDCQLLLLRLGSLLRKPKSAWLHPPVRPLRSRTHTGSPCSPLIPTELWLTPFPQELLLTKRTPAPPLASLLL